MFPALSTEEEFSITTIQDSEIESDELAIFNIESIEDSIYLVVTMVIIDDDEPLPLSIENKNTLNEVFPNPAKDIINLKINNQLKIESIKLTDLEGKEFKPKNIILNEKFINFDVSNLDEGIYVIQILTNDDILKVKLIIDRNN